MFYTPITNVSQKRTLRPLYAQHQATPYGGFLDSAWNRAVDIYPGMVMTKLGGENFTLCNGGATMKPFGLSALFVAPTLGIDEVKPTNTNLFTVWVGGADAVFEILAPAFDTTATWTVPTDGSRKMLYVTNTTHSLKQGLLSPTTGSTVGTDAIAELIDVVGTSKIIVRLNRFA